jgi:acyl-CoA synthetase (AMP-forming)/AMP-acid ligase II/acyl carrier protein
VGYTFLVDGETEEQNLTYAELDLRARAIAARMQSVCRPGEHALLLYGPGLDYIAALFACQYAGVIPVPAYPPDPLRSSRTLPRLRAIVDDCGATLALGTAESFGWLGSVQTSQLGLKLTLATDEWGDWVGLPWTPPDTNADQVALLQYTSGSTSRPRGVMVTHRNLWHQFENMRVGDGEDAVGVTWLPLYHDLGLIGGALTPIYFRRQVVLMSPLAFVQHPLRWLLAVSRYRATTTGAPNFAFDLCVSKFSAAEAGRLDLSSLRILLTGAEPVRSDTLDRFTATFAPTGLRPDVWRPCYGLAEATLGVTGIRFGTQLARGDFSIRALGNNQAVVVTEGAEPARRLVGCGWGLEGGEVLIVDPDSRTELPEGRVGEVWVSGPNVARGYWNRPEETEALFNARLAEGRGPFLRTGDLGFQHQGQLYLTGRLKEVMVFWGRNVYPQDVEMTVWKCDPLLKENAGAAFAVEAGGQEQLVVVQEVARPGKMDLDAVATAIRQAVEAEHRVLLHSLVFIKAGTLPKTSSGKTQRHVAREQFLGGELEVVRQWHFPGALALLAAAAPTATQEPRSRDEIRAWLVARVARQCNLPEDQIDPAQPLTRYVLDSVSAVAIAIDLQQWLGRSLSPTILYDSPSVAVLAERLAEPQAYPAEAGPVPTSVDQMSPAEVDRALAELLGGAVNPDELRPGP